MAIVLVVEDEVALLILAESFLKQAGYLTVTASTVAEAKALIESDQKLDLVFTDISLGDDGEAGLHVGHVVRDTRPGLPVLYTTGRGVTDGMIKLFVEPGAFLAKPYTGPQLVTAIANLLRANYPHG